MSKTDKVLVSVKLIYGGGTEKVFLSPLCFPLYALDALLILVVLGD